MLKKIFALCIIVSVLLVNVIFLVPAPVYAQTAKKALTAEERCEKFKAQFQLGSNGEKVNVNIADDVPFFCTAQGFAVKLINYMLLISGTITMLFLIIGGYWYLTSAGNDEQAEKGKKTLLNAILGLVVITMAYAIVAIVSNLLTEVAK